MTPDERLVLMLFRWLFRERYSVVENLCWAIVAAFIGWSLR